MSETQAPSAAHDTHPRPSFVEGLLGDVRFAFRTLRRSPGYTAAAVGVLALGIGANTAIFSVIRGVLLAPLPFARGEELMLVRQAAPAAQVPDAAVSIPELAAYRERLHSVKDLVEYHGMSFALLKQGEPDRVDTGVVSANFFRMLGVKPQLGRDFVAADEQHGAEAVLLLSHRYWQEKFGGDPKVAGRVVEMNNRPHTIIGVLPDFPQYPRENDVYMPTSACPFRDQAAQTLAGGQRTFAGLTVFGRLAPAAQPAQANAEVAAVASTFTKDHPEDYERVRDLAGRVEPLQETLVAQARPMLLALSGATALVLLLACANVANLALARTARRQRELGMRTALGAGRLQLLRQLLTESLVVALLGGLLGVGLAWLCRGMLVGFVGRFTPRTGQIAIDGSVFAFALAASLLTGLAFGAAPALAVGRNLMRSVREGAAQAGGGRSRMRAALVVGQVAISFVLLVGAGLLLHSFWRLASVRLGYDTQNVLTASIFGNFTSMSADPLGIHSKVLDRLRDTPTVVAAAVTSAVPLSDINPGVQIVELESGAEAGKDGGEPRQVQADPNIASEGYFETLGVPVLRGRTFRESDGPDQPQVAVINSAMAQLLGDGDPVGVRFRTVGGHAAMMMGDAPPPWITVIGVVGDFRLYQPDSGAIPQYYQSFRQTGGFAGRVLVRTRTEPHELLPTLKKIVHGVDSTTPVEDVQTLADLRAGALAGPRLTASLLGLFALVAMLVTLAGIAGVIGTSVTQRTRELGIRMALGASRRSVLRMVLGEGVGLVALGLVLGAAGAFAFGRVLARFLFETQHTDLAAYVTVGVLLLVGALLAALPPARRATATAPIVAFKVE